jgi:hypothetical protein
MHPCYKSSRYRTYKYNSPYVKRHTLSRKNTQEAAAGNQMINGSITADAMPIFTDISNWMLDYLKIQPKG